MRTLLLPFLAAILFGFTLGESIAQDEKDVEPMLPITVKENHQEQQITKQLIAVASIGICTILVSAIIAIGLILAYRSNQISAATAFFIAGVVLIACPILGITANAIGQSFIAANAFTNLAKINQAPDARMLANNMAAASQLTILMYATFFAVPFGVIAIITAFFIRKPFRADRD